MALQPSFLGPSMEDIPARTPSSSRTSRPMGLPNNGGERTVIDRFTAFLNRRLRRGPPRASRAPRPKVSYLMVPPTVARSEIATVASIQLIPPDGAHGGLVGRP